MMDRHIIRHLNSYPETLAVRDDKTLVTFDQRDHSSTKGFALTRPLKLDMADVHKTVDNIIQRGHFRKGNVQSAVYGSRNGFDWQLVWTSSDHYLRGFSGTPYKFFRIAILTTLPEEQGVYGASVQFTPRLTNQPR